mmetsp:Transcript_51832/g.121545  ORF Transcript_51832/g.121545 Transcript_51832/m.121545 type:complete len:264 (-) Transcript_51832:39-830(-)
MAGMITKQGGRWKTWHSRHAVLHGTRLSYYNTEADTTEAGWLDVAGTHVCEDDTKPHAFIITGVKGAKRATYIMACENDVQRNSWIRAINSAGGGSADTARRVSLAAKEHLKRQAEQRSPPRPKVSPRMGGAAAPRPTPSPAPAPAPAPVVAPSVSPKTSPKPSPRGMHYPKAGAHVPTGLGGTPGDKCVRCKKTVYAVEKVVQSNLTFHKACFSCAGCKHTLALGNCQEHDGELYCKGCYGKMYGPKGIGFGIAHMETGERR